MHKGILLSLKKECIWVSFDEMDEPRTYYTEWSESEKERLISHSNAYIRNLERWYWRIYLQDSNGETDIENRLNGPGEREGEGEIYGKSNMETYITICKINIQQEFAVWLRKLKQGFCINLEEWGGEGDWKEVQKGGDTCISMADSSWCLTGNNKIL